MEPSDLAAGMERNAGLLPGAGDRFRGYGVLGLAFLDGDVLAMRRFPATSRGPAYTSVWHRTCDGRWTFFVDIGSDCGCSRYFRPDVVDVVVTPIRLEWPTTRRLTVSIDGGRVLAWSICLCPSVRSRLVTACAPALPLWCQETPAVRRALERLVALTFGLGEFHLAGHTPSGHGFQVTPRAFWHVEASRARLCGRDLGALAALDSQVALADFWVPRQGLFVAGEVHMSEPASRASDR